MADSPEKNNPTTQAPACEHNDDAYWLVEWPLLLRAVELQGIPVCGHATLRSHENCVLLLHHRIPGARISYVFSEGRVELVLHQQVVDPVDRRHPLGPGEQ
ncbi:hypothetical protein HNY73_001683 [Argiope bruennichi]|uniref:Uncharacterized protein n=1 Tax=Argiope bruennichi TaxID=94029 RepID=A0A8T0FRA8_ARGBR|nr:hypothetical protein HNY73_001683 [Argiope bruennichi]